MIPGFFKRGVHAERVRAILSELGVLTLERFNDGDEVFSDSDTAKDLRLATAGFDAVEYEAFGYLAGINVSAHWTIQVKTSSTVLQETEVKFHGGFGETWKIPWYIRGRHAEPAVNDVYTLNMTNVAGGAMHVLGARLYGIR